MQMEFESIICLGDVSVITTEFLDEVEVFELTLINKNTRKCLMQQPSIKIRLLSKELNHLKLPKDKKEQHSRKKYIDVSYIVNPIMSLKMNLMMNRTYLQPKKIKFNPKEDIFFKFLSLCKKKTPEVDSLRIKAADTTNATEDYYDNFCNEQLELIDKIFDYENKAKIEKSIRGSSVPNNHLLYNLMFPPESYTYETVQSKSFNEFSKSLCPYYQAKHLYGFAQENFQKFKEYVNPTPTISFNIQIMDFVTLLLFNNEFLILKIVQNKLSDIFFYFCFQKTSLLIKRKQNFHYIEIKVISFNNNLQ